MKKRLKIDSRRLLKALILVVVLEGTALADSIDFEIAEGYSAGILFGQPSTGNQWNGDSTAKIAVTSAVAQSGSQSVRVDPSVLAGKVSDYVGVSSTPNRFSLKFYWRPSGTNQGDATIYLSQFGSDTTTAIGPWVAFVGGGAVYQIKYNENGVTKNIKLAMDPFVYENNWWEVEIVGDLSSHTFDFYLDGTLEKSDLGFRNTLSPNLATSLNYLGLQASNTGASNHSFDDIRIAAAPGVVPALSRPGLLVLLAVCIGSGLWIIRREQSALRA